MACERSSKMASSKPWKTDNAGVDSSAASEAFRVHRDSLLSAIPDVPELLAKRLHSEGIISNDQYLDVQMLGIPSKKKENLVNAIETGINTNPKVFPTFLDVLYESPHPVKIFSERIWSSYLHCKVCESIY